MKARGSQLDAGITLKRWMSENEYFEDCEDAVVYTPIGLWKQGKVFRAWHLLCGSYHSFG